MKFEYKQFMQAFNLLDGRLYINRSNSYSIVVCGGAALNAMRLVIRTTKDVDILSLIDSDNNLSDPEPLPDELLTAAIETANSLGLPNDWLNNGPSSGDGGIFRMGLPDGFRISAKKFLREFGYEQLAQNL